MKTSTHRALELDALDLDLLTVLQSEFEHSGLAGDESSVMIKGASATDSHTLWAYAASLTGWMKEMLLGYAGLLNVDPEPIHRHHMLVVPDLRFGASCRRHKGRDYILLNSGCIDLLSYLVELDILATQLIHTAPTDSVTYQLLKWLMDAGISIARNYIVMPFGLPLIRPYMDDEMNQAEVVILGSAELFVFLHEVAHVALGHLGSGFGESTELTTLPKAEEEYAADRYAMEWMARGRPSAVVGAVKFLSYLSLIETGRLSKSDGTASVKDRLLALKHALGDSINIQVVSDIVSPAQFETSDMQTDPKKSLREFRWACRKVANEIGIKVSDEAATDPSFPDPGRGIPRGAAMEIVRMLHRHEGHKEIIQEYLSLAGDWEKQRLFVDGHPAMLSREVEEWFITNTYFANVDDDFRIFLKSELLLLRRCREVGTEKALPINDVLIELLEATSLGSQCEILRVHPHVLTSTGRERAALLYRQLLDVDVDRAWPMRFIVEIINEAISLGIDACLEHRRNIPTVSGEVGRFMAQLDLAIINGDIRSQIEICESALAFAASEEGVPTWSLRFKEHLQSLPEF